MQRRSRRIRWCPGFARLIAAFICIVLSACEPKLRSDNADAAAEPSEATETKKPTLVFPSVDPGPEPAPDLPGLTIPHRRSIKNQAGVTLDGEILAKSGDEIAFRRDTDGQTFLIALPTLSPVDQLAIQQLPDAGLPMIESLRPASTGVANAKNRPPLLTELQAHGTFAEAQAVSKASGRPLLVIVTGEPEVATENLDASATSAVMNPEASRKACLSLIRTVLGDRSFAGYVNERFEYYYLDLLEEGGLGAPDQGEGDRVLWDNGINDYPTFIVFSPETQEVGRMVGYDGKGPSRVMARLDDILGKTN